MFDHQERQAKEAAVNRKIELIKAMQKAKDNDTKFKQDKRDLAAKEKAQD